MGSDAHFTDTVGSFELAEKALYETQFPPELVMNYDAAKFKAFRMTFPFRPKEAINSSWGRILLKLQRPPPLASSFRESRSFRSRIRGITPPARKDTADDNPAGPEPITAAIFSSTVYSLPQVTLAPA